MESARTGEYIGWNQLGLENIEDGFSWCWRIYRMKSASAGEYIEWNQLVLETIKDGFS